MNNDINEVYRAAILKNDYKVLSNFIKKLDSFEARSTLCSIILSQNLDSFAQIIMDSKSFLFQYFFLKLLHRVLNAELVGKDPRFTDKREEFNCFFRCTYFHLAARQFLVNSLNKETTNVLTGEIRGLTVNNEKNDDNACLFVSCDNICIYTMKTIYCLKYTSLESVDMYSSTLQIRSPDIVIKFTLRARGKFRQVLVNSIHSRLTETQKSEGTKLCHKNVSSPVHTLCLNSSEQVVSKGANVDTCSIGSEGKISSVSGESLPIAAPVSCKNCDGSHVYARPTHSDRIGESPPQLFLYKDYLRVNYRTNRNPRAALARKGGNRNRMRKIMRTLRVYQKNVRKQSCRMLKIRLKNAKDITYRIYRSMKILDEL